MADITKLFLQGLGLVKSFIDMRDGTHAELQATSNMHVKGMEWYTAIGLGLLSPDVRRVTALGNNPDTDAATVPEDVWTGGGVYPWLTAATSLEIVSSSASDTAAGVGARSVIINGLDINYVEQSDTMTMNGLTAVAVPRQYYRINNAVVVTAGTSENNVGTITIRDSGGGTTRGLISPGIGITKQAVYTVPAGHTLSIHSFFASLNRSTGAIDKTATVATSFRSSLGVLRMPLEFSVSTVVPYRQDGDPGITATEKTDVFLRVTFTSVNDTDVTAAFLGVLVNTAAL